MKKIISCLSILFLLTSGIGLAREPLEVSINADNPGAEIQPTMWGVFFEDINFAADGGIYAEPVPILNCGMSCQFNAAEVVPLEELPNTKTAVRQLLNQAPGRISILFQGRSLSSQLKHRSV